MDQKVVSLLWCICNFISLRADLFPLSWTRSLIACLTQSHIACLTRPHMRWFSLAASLSVSRREGGLVFQQPRNTILKFSRGWVAVDEIMAVPVPRELAPCEPLDEVRPVRSSRRREPCSRDSDAPYTFSNVGGRPWISWSYNICRVLCSFHRGSWPTLQLTCGWWWRRCQILPRTWWMCTSYLIWPTRFLRFYSLRTKLIDWTFWVLKFLKW